MTTSEAPATLNTTEHQEEDRSTQRTNDVQSQVKLNKIKDCQQNACTDCFGCVM